MEVFWVTKKGYKLNTVHNVFQLLKMSLKYLFEYLQNQQGWLSKSLFSEFNGQEIMEWK